MVILQYKNCMITYLSVTKQEATTNPQKAKKKFTASDLPLGGPYQQVSSVMRPRSYVVACSIVAPKDVV
jgi:hypothetical protein